MSGKLSLKVEKRNRRTRKVRAKILGKSSRPRLSVFRSNRYVYGQIIDDENGTTLLSADTREAKDKSSLEKAKSSGRKIGQEAVKKGIKKVVFDRGGYLYAGKIRAFADGAREGGLEF